MTTAIVASSSLLAVVLTVALVRERRLRRALQALLRRLLFHWRSHGKTINAADAHAGGDADHDARV
jgi:hypothetical protein